MPRLQQLQCSLLLGQGGTALPEFRTKYHDGTVECRVATPDNDTNFSVLLRATSNISPGLAVFVYIDGIYQCNRNVAVSPSGTVEIRLRQKEEKLADGSFIGREWTFARLGTAPSGAKRDRHFERNVGKIEVVVRRCYYGVSDPAKKPSYTKAVSSASTKSKASESDSAAFSGFNLFGDDGAQPQLDGADDMNVDSRAAALPIYDWNRSRDPFRASTRPHERLTDERLQEDKEDDRSVHGVYRPGNKLDNGHSSQPRSNDRKKPEEPKERDQSIRMDRLLDMRLDELDIALAKLHHPSSKKARDKNKQVDKPASHHSKASRTKDHIDEWKSAWDQPVSSHADNDKQAHKSASHRSRSSKAKNDVDAWMFDQDQKESNDTGTNKQEDNAVSAEIDQQPAKESEPAVWGAPAPEHMDNAVQENTDDFQTANEPAAAGAWNKDDQQPKAARASKHSASHDGSGSTSDSSSTEARIVMPYWSAWNKSTTSGHSSTPRTARRDALRSPYQYPALPEPVISSKSKTTADRGVHSGEGATYEHQTNRPIYIDSMVSPYAVFIFKYSSQEKLEERLGRKITKEMEAIIHQAERDRLLGMSKEQMVEELLKMRKKHGGNSPSTVDAPTVAEDAPAAKVEMWNSGASNKSKKSTKSKTPTKESKPPAMEPTGGFVPAAMKSVAEETQW